MKNNLLSKFNKKIAVILLILTLIIAGYFVYINTLFSISNITPNNKRFPNSLNKFTITFNKPIHTDEIVSRYKNNPNSVFTTNIPGSNTLIVNEKSMEISFQKTPSSGVFELKLISITSAKGNKTINKTLLFDFKDIPYSKLSDVEKKAYDDFSNIAEEPPRGQKVIELLPYQTSNYLIQYIYGPEESEDSTGTILITMKFFPETIASQELTEDQTSEYLNNIRKYRNEAIDWLKSNDFDLNDFYVEYSEPEILNEFPSGRSSTGDDL